MVDETTRTVETIELEKKKLQEQLDQHRKMTEKAEDEARFERLRWEDDFRKRSLDMLNGLIERINGHPKETLERLEKLTEKLDEVLKIKEELTPRWVKILLASVCAFMLALIPALFSAWWYLSSLSKYLPVIVEYLQRHEDIIKLLDTISKMLPKS